MTIQSLRDDEIRRLLGQTARIHDMVLLNELSLEVVRRVLDHVLAGGDIDKTSPGALSYFASQAQQIDNIVRWNTMFGWGFTGAQITQCILEARTFNWPGDSLQALVLVPSFTSPVATLRELMRAADHLNVWPAGLLDTLGIDTRFALIRGIEFEPDKLEWSHVDLGSHLWTQDGDHSPRVFDVAESRTAAHAEVLAAAAHFPKWLNAIASGEAPGVIIPGYRVIHALDGLVQQTEYLSLRSTSSQRVAMLRLCDGVMWNGCAIPTANPMTIGPHVY